MNDWLRDLIPEWSPLRWMITLGALLVLVFTGISIFHTPRYEVIYSGYLVQVPYGEQKTAVMVTMEFGNTGTAEQDYVRVKFYNSAVDRAVLPITARMFGIRKLPVRITRGEAMTTYDIGALEPGKRVQISTVLNYSAGEALDTWEQIYMGMEVANGSVRQGDPAGTTFARAMFTMFTSW